MGFAHDESVKVEYIETTKVLEHPDYIDCKPRNWIPRRNRPQGQWSYRQPKKEPTPEYNAKRTKEQHERSKGSSPTKVHRGKAPNSRSAVQ